MKSSAEIITGEDTRKFIIISPEIPKLDSHIAYNPDNAKKDFFVSCVIHWV